ncbi:hypothetical protein NQ176_g8905 [Zarea fungicola]|uniref:Uncharacterized protein n=1 Tax=Zarea fungicola TaxID=93591 RepID=A0ACC1MQ94_9HYPO|nr:hypothetical protein NQ176_g8905 [Lecanicillium fungicola]
MRARANRAVGLRGDATVASSRRQKRAYKFGASDGAAKVGEAKWTFVQSTEDGVGRELLVCTQSKPNGEFEEEQDKKEEEPAWMQSETLHELG